MNKNIGIIIGIVVLIILGGIYASKNSKNDAMIEKEQIEQKSIEDKKTTEEEGAMMEKDETSIVDKSDTMMKVGVYEAYDPLKLARAEAGDVVLFFHASWCPSCRGLNSDIEKNLGAIPEGVSILKTDYDTETELKKKYGITYQHTLVQVDKSGNLIKKWSGSGTLSNLVSQIQ